MTEITASYLLGIASEKLGRGLRPVIVMERRAWAICGGASRCDNPAIAVDVRNRHWSGGRFSQDVYFHCEDHGR